MRYGPDLPESGSLYTLGHSTEKLTPRGVARARGWHAAVLSQAAALAILQAGPDPDSILFCLEQEAAPTDAVDNLAIPVQLMQHI